MIEIKNYPSKKTRKDLMNQYDKLILMGKEIRDFLELLPTPIACSIHRNSFLYGKWEIEKEYDICFKYSEKELKKCVRGISKKTVQDVIYARTTFLKEGESHSKGKEL